MRQVIQHRAAVVVPADQQDRPDANAFSLFNESNDIDTGS